MGIVCSGAIKLGLEVGKRICSSRIFGKVSVSELQIMLCLKS